MSIGWLAALTIVLFVLLKYVAFVIMVQPKEPPQPVRIAGIAETAFGSIVFFGGAYICGVEKSKSLGVFLMLLGLFWIGVAVSLYKASRIGRTICLVLSIARIPTVIGACFSLLSIYKIYFVQESKDFFDRTKDDGVIANGHNN